MITAPAKNPFYELAHAEHRELRQLIDRICLLAADRTSDASKIHPALVELQRYLQEHFHREEEGGYLEEAVTQLPRLAQRIAALERQHGPLLEQLADLVDGVQDTAWAPEGRDKLAQRWQAFCRALQTHEEAEDGVLEEAFGAFQFH
jgi:iron-sulfur cluster repair protein YtfE (RIC family)